MSTMPSTEFGETLAIRTDFGEVGRGASNARYIEASDGNEYLIKGPSLAPDNPMVGANELIAVRLAAKLGLPVLGHAVVERNGDWFFASNWMNKAQFSPALDRELFLKCENQDCIYGTAVFDAWLINKDRHHENLIARRVGRTNPPRHTLLLNDHSHLLANPLLPKLPSQLMGQVDNAAAPYVTLSFLRESIRGAARLRGALEAIEQLSDEEVAAVVDATPDELLSAAHKPLYVDFLNQRRVRLRGVMQKEPSPFPNLRGSI
ncbi:MAG TPA: hypothetical protein VFL77_04380 [Solirubrobacterales bacterium]|nr:hypothetical protein [Solirubrobacterales bacterium]